MRILRYLLAAADHETQTSLEHSVLQVGQHDSKILHELCHVRSRNHGKDMVGTDSRQVTVMYRWMRNAGDMHALWNE